MRHGCSLVEVCCGSSIPCAASYCRQCGIGGIKIVRMRESLIVGVGAVLGAFARWGLSLAAGSVAMMAAVPNAGFWSLLLSNILGTGVMCYCHQCLFWLMD